MKSGLGLPKHKTRRRLHPNQSKLLVKRLGIYGTVFDECCRKVSDQQRDTTPEIEYKSLTLNEETEIRNQLRNVETVSFKGKEYCLEKRDDKVKRRENQFKKHNLFQGRKGEYGQSEKFTKKDVHFQGDRSRTWDEKLKEWVYSR